VKGHHYPVAGTAIGVFKPRRQPDLRLVADLSWAVYCRLGVLRARLQWLVFDS